MKRLGLKIIVLLLTINSSLAQHSSSVHNRFYRGITNSIFNDSAKFSLEFPYSFKVLNQQDYESLEREGFQNLVNREQGVVVINGEFYTPHNLVDGQQRLTTILILLSQLIKKIKKNVMNTFFILYPLSLLKEQK